MGKFAQDGARYRGCRSRTNPTTIHLRPVSIVVALALLLGGCDRSNEEIKVYRVVKAPLESAPSSDSGAPPDAAALGFLSGTVPPTWEPQPLSQMRQASFLVRGEEGAVADISFVTLGSAAGNVLDNVNRWLSQLAQPPITAETLAATVQQLTTATGDVAVVDLTGDPEGGDIKKDGRIIAAIASDDRSTAFYKMRGNPELVGQEKGNFLKWVRTSRNAGGSNRTADAERLADSPIPKIKWDLPADWSAGPPSAMRYASFTTGENAEKVDISVITFPGDGGNDLDNVNRWRQQVGLPPIDANALNASITLVSANDLQFFTVDLAGETAQTIAGWTRNDGRAWFFKLTGPKQAVQREKAKFVKFIQSIRF